MVELNRLFEEYLFASLEEYTDPIPGVIPTLEKLRTEGLKIGSTTGYTREMMDVVLPAALAKGYCVDYCATPNFLPAGRPAYKVAEPAGVIFRMIWLLRSGTNILPSSSNAICSGLFKRTVAPVPFT